MAGAEDEMAAFEAEVGGFSAASHLIAPPPDLSEPEIAHSHVYEDFEVRGELRISTGQCALIGRMYQQDMQAPPEAWAKANPERNIHSLHGVADVIANCAEANQTCVRYQYRVMPDQSHGVSLFHAYIRWEENDFYIYLNEKHSGPDDAHFKLRKVWFIDPLSHRSDVDRDLYGTVVPVVDSEGKQVMLNDGDRSRVKVQLDRSKSRLRAKLVDGDVIQIGNESVNRLRLTIYKGELGDGVPSYLHIREEPDPRHIPIMMKLWELTERMEVLQSSVDKIMMVIGGGGNGVSNGEDAGAPVLDLSARPSAASVKSASAADNVAGRPSGEYLKIGKDAE